MSVVSSVLCITVDDRFPMANLRSGRLAITLTHRVAQGASSADVATAIISSWLSIDIALTPIIGQGGVVALYKRGVYLTTPHFPWLNDALKIAPPPLDFSVLKSVLLLQNSIDAAGGGALLKNFYELLASLIGPALTERLLQSAWTNPFSGESAQDISP